jgi:uncharacterized protein YkwD
MRNRLNSLLTLVVLASCAVAGQVQAAQPTPDQILTELNFARTEPLAYARQLRVYRTHFDGMVALDAGEQGIMTQEGVAAVDEAIAFLQRQPPRVALSLNPLLNRSAGDQAQDQAQTGRIGHVGSNGSTFTQRISREGSWQGEAAEAISYGMVSAADVVRQLIIDDGVADRGHRDTLFDPVLRNVGAGCAPHETYREVCVLDFTTAIVAKPRG